MPFVDTDRRILTNCLQREPGAWEEFVDRFAGVFVHVIRHTSHVRSVELSSDDVDDLCSEIFVTLLKNDFAVLRHFKGHSSLATYLAVVARRIVVKSLVQRRRSEAMGHVIAHHSALEAGGANGEADAEQVRLLMSQLPPSEAAIVRLFYLEGKSYQDISRQLGVPENSIGPMLSRARARMRNSAVTSAS